ncbi:MAG: rhodanese-like domain-containing protein [Actinomycetota bacterium]
MRREGGSDGQGSDGPRRGSQGRSALGAATLKEMGYTNVAHLDGGMKAWQEAGRPTEP